MFDLSVELRVLASRGPNAKRKTRKRLCVSPIFQKLFENILSLGASFVGSPPVFGVFLQGCRAARLQGNPISGLDFTHLPN